MKKIYWLSASAAALLSAGTAHAEGASAPDPASAPAPDDAAAAPDQDGDILITAERRSTSMQKAPVAASVLTGDDLIKKSVNNVEGLQFATPSLTVNTTGQGNAFNIRGIGKTEQGSAITVGVITYRDGVATLPGYFQSEPYYDIASVEVLRGPQGTFAGGNATGGAVFITEKNPDLTGINGYALAQYGNYNDVKLQGAVNVPLTDTLAIRVAGNMEHRSTFYHMSGPWTGNPGDLRGYSGRISLLWQPDSHLRVLLKGDYNNIEYGGLPASPATSTADPLYVASDAFLSGRDETKRVVLNLSYTFDSGLVLRSISGYQHGLVTGDIDSDATASGTPLGFHDAIPEEIWSQEFNIISPDTGRFTWLIGGYWQNDTIFFPTNSVVTKNSPALGVNTVIVGKNPRTALAAFGQVGYKLTDSLQFQIGARWSRSTNRNDAVAAAIIPLTPPVTLLQITQHDFTSNSQVNWKAALNWNLDANNFLYAFVATGTKAGGLNAPNIYGVTPKPFKPEDVTDFEIGWKSTLFGGHLRTQLGGYYNEFKNFQVAIVDPTFPAIGSVLNVPGKTKLYGAEFSAQGSFDAFSFDLATSISHSEIGTFFAADSRLGAAATTCNPQTGPAGGRCLDLSGHAQTYAPEFTFSVGAQYAIPLGGNATLTPRIDYAHISSVWSTLFQSTVFKDHLAARNIVNAQLTLNTGPWTIAGYSTNLGDQHYVAATNGIRRLAGAPRQYGIRVSRSF